MNWHYNIHINNYFFFHFCDLGMELAIARVCRGVCHFDFKIPKYSWPKSQAEDKQQNVYSRVPNRQGVRFINFWKILDDLQKLKSK